MKTINLDALANSGHRVEIGGQLYLVRQITARVANIIAVAEAPETEPIERMRGYYDGVALLLPGMARLDVDNLSPSQVGRIIQIARTEADAVDEATADPNAVSSAPTETPAAEPPPAT